MAHLLCAAPARFFGGALILALGALWRGGMPAARAAGHRAAVGPELGRARAGHGVGFMPFFFVGFCLPPLRVGCNCPRCQRTPPPVAMMGLGWCVALAGFMRRRRWRRWTGRCRLRARPADRPLRIARCKARPPTATMPSCAAGCIASALALWAASLAWRWAKRSRVRRRICALGGVGLVFASAAPHDPLLHRGGAASCMAPARAARDLRR
jgi:hypothetical protein